MRSVLGPSVSALSSDRVAVRRMIPLFAKATIVNVQRHLPPDPPDAPLERLSSAISQTDYAKHWSRYHHGPGFEAHVLGILIRLVPKVGILKILAVKPPSAQTEGLFVKSLDTALDRFEALLRELANEDAAEFVLANRDLDTGARVRPGAYKLTDQTYPELVQKLSATPCLAIPEGLRQDILAYYSDPAAPISTKQNRKLWIRVQTELDSLDRQAAADRTAR